MSPRRMQAESEEPTQTEGSVASPAPKPKKKRSTTRKKAPAKKAEAGVEAPPPTPTFGAPPAPPAAKPPVDIPIRPIPPIAVPQRMVIEPDVHAADEIEEFWKPSSRDGIDLKTPPQVLLQSKKASKPEIEDVLEEPEGEGHEADREDLRPAARTGVFRKIALGFAVLAVVVAALVAYVVYAHATVTVYPEKSVVKTEQDLTVADDPQDGDVPGQVAEITVTGERTEAPSQSTTTDGTARGSVTLFNQTAADQVLVATTRLITPEGVLFRLKSRVDVPAHGKVSAEAYADKAGAAGDIGPSAFTIPGLSLDLQKTIFAKSDAAMTGGTVSTGVIAQADIDKTEQDLRDDLSQQAKTELAKAIDAKWSGRAFVIETMNRVVSGSVGETASGVTVRLTLRVRGSGFDRDKALALAADGLKRALTSERELTSVDADHASFDLTSADPKAKTAALHVTLSGESRVSLDSPLLDVGKLRGLDLKAVQAYFEDIEGVERVDVQFQPFWIKRMPDLADHIRLIVAK